MTVHANDVAHAIRKALAEETMVGEPTELHSTPNPDAGLFPNRDGHHEFVVAGRDCVRGFRITVEAIPFEDVDRLAHPEQYA